MSEIKLTSASAAWPAQGNTRVPYWVYTDPEIYRLEQDRIFGQADWHYVALAVEIPNVGDYKLSHVGDKPVIVTRSSDGAIHVLLNQCAHRGVRICRRHLGSASEITCPYHHWTYALDGRLIGVPFLRGLKKQGGYPRDFAPEKHGLCRLQVHERNGVVFASFKASPEPFEQFVGPEMLTYFDRVFDGRPLRVLGYQRQAMRANWKTMVDNIKDPYHATILHVFLITFGLFRSDQRSSTILDASGRHSVFINSRVLTAPEDEAQALKNFRPEFALQDASLLQPVKEYPGQITVAIQFLYPNLIIQQQSNTLAMRQIVPREPERYELHWTFFGYAGDDDAMVRRRLLQANLMGCSGYVSIDDSEIVELAQLGMRPRAENDGILELDGDSIGSADHTVTETAVRGFYRYYREVMGL